MGFGPLPWGAVILLLAIHTATAGPALDYLYIEANSGTSSGGHVAVKLDETVYHFQNKDGLILLQRDAWPRFRHLYADLDNRDIHVARAAIPESVLIQVKQHLDLFHLTQKALLDRAASLDRDVQLLESLAEARPYQVPGAGFFNQNPHFKEGSPRFRELASKETRDSLRRRLQSLIQTRRDLRYFVTEANRQDFTPANFSQSFADRWIDLVQNEISFMFVLGQKEFDQTLLMDGGPLPPEKSQNDCSARRWLEGYRRHLAEDAEHLLLQPYPGSGITLLRTLARLEAVRLSLERERLLLLLPGLTSSNALQHNDEYLQGAQHRLEAEFRAHLETLSQRTFCANEIDDLAYHKLELAALDLQETVQANQHEIPVQFDHDPDLPNAPSPIPLDAIDRSRGPEKTDLKKAIASRDRLQDHIKEKMRYNLITRNCVTELIKAMNAGFENDQEPPEFQGHIEPLRSQAFVPFRFFELVLKQYPVESSTRIPSYRHQRLSQLIAQENEAWVEMREGNTLTSTLYHPRQHDGVFLFFTDGSVWSRPILGSVNLGTAMIAMTLGMIGLPLDEGRLLEAGARGALFSLPEIALWNIRKGTYTEAALRK